MKKLMSDIPSEHELTEKNIGKNKNFIASFSKLIKITKRSISTPLHWQIMIPTMLKDLVHYSS